jgi:crotonobetainyl-CoA:carnitine CoA-transferase CaiB-like acyl-CoA transferase
MPESSFEPPLAGLRLLELGRDVAAPYCGRLLADFGADVLRVEPPGGDPLRHSPPLLDGARPESPSLLYLYLNHGKSVLNVDPSAAASRDQLLDLVAQADVLIENLEPDALDQIGLTWDRLHSLNPRLVLTSISPFGRTGPYRNFKGSDIVCDAVGGLAYVFGYRDREPLTHPNPQAQYRAGTYAATATVAALLNLGESGERIDISVTECVAAGLREVIPAYTYMGAIRNRSAEPEGGFGDVVACADGYVIPTVWGASDFSTFSRFLEAPALDDERFATGEGRERYASEIARLLNASLKRWKKHEFFHRAQEWGIGAGIVLSPDEVLRSEQLASRGFFTEVELDSGGSVPLPRGPFQL